MKVTFALFLICIASMGMLRGESELRMRGKESQKERKSLPPPITPCAGPKVQEGIDVNLSADFLYWTARLDTLTYAKTGLETINNIIGPSSATSVRKGEVQAVDWTWDPGFKVGIGWNFAHGCWDMRLQYTWFYTNVGGSKRSSTMQPGFQIFTFAEEVQLSNVSFNRAHAHFDLHYQVGDLELGRNYYVSRTLKLRPFVGLKGTWQKQDYNVFYEAVPFESFTDQFFDFTARFNHAIYGIGMRGGLNTAWQFSKVFSLYGSLSFTGMWIHYNTDRKDTLVEVTETPNTGIPQTTLVNLQDRLRLIKPVLEFEIGFRVETYFKGKRFHALFQAGWESQLWLNQTLYISLNDHFDRFDLSLQGLTGKFRFDF